MGDDGMPVAALGLVWFGVRSWGVGWVSWLVKIL